MALLNFQTKLEINTKPAGQEPAWAVVAKGFKNVASSLNEVLYQASYMSDEGYGSSEVTGGQLTFSLTGDRVPGDPAQDYIFSPDVRYKFGEARKTQARITNGNERLTAGVTIAKADNTGGDANTVQTIAVDIHVNGKPEIETTDDGGTTWTKKE